MLLSVLMASSVLTGCLGGQESQTEETEIQEQEEETQEAEEQPSQETEAEPVDVDVMALNRAYSHGYGKIYG